MNFFKELSLSSPDQPVTVIYAEATDGLKSQHREKLPLAKMRNGTNSTVPKEPEGKITEMRQNLIFL